MKISIIGAGNVGGLTAMRLAQDGLGDIFLIDVIKGLAEGKALDLDDARAILKLNYNVFGSQSINDIKNSDIVIITAGFPRKSGMSREELLNKNAAVLKDISLSIKKLAAKAIIIVVTNPLDLMTLFVLKTTGFKTNKVFGIGSSLDASRFANLIAKELKISPVDVDACVIGAHGKGMLALPKFTNIKGVSLDEFLKEAKIAELVQKTLQRGAQIISLLGSTSAYFAPSAAIANLVKIIVKDEKRTVNLSTYLNGEYGISGVSISVPCRLGRRGIEEIIELDLDSKEKTLLAKSVKILKEEYKLLGTATIF